MEKFQCGQCPRSFKRQEHLRRHQKVHETHKPFECHICHKGFTRSDILHKHIAIHDHPAAPAADRRDTARRRACLECAKAREKCTRTTPCQRCSIKSLSCIYPDNADRQPMVSSRTDNVSLMQSGGSMGLTRSVPSNQQLSISPQEDPNTRSSPYLEDSGDTSMQQAPPFEYDLGPCDIDWDFPMNWLPYNNEIETNYCSILGLDNNIASTGSLHPSCGNEPTLNQPTSTIPVLGNTPQTISTVGSISQGNGAAASPQLSMSSDRTTPGDLYATSSNGARRPCTDRSRQLFPPLGVEGCTKLWPVSLDPSLHGQSNIWEFPDLDHMTIEATDGVRDFALTQATYAKIYDSFENTCLEAGIFGNEFTSSEFPPLAIMDYCIKLFFEHFNPILPLVHPNTTDLNANWVLVLAICVVGSQYSATDDINDCVLPFQEFLRRVLVVHLQLENSEMDIALAQALVLSQVGLLYYSTIINLYRRSHAQVASDVKARLNQRETNIHQEWKVWVEDETLRRLCYFIWLLDRMGCYFFDDHHASTFDVQDIVLPHDGLWSQTCSLDWSKVYRRVEENPSLLSAVNTIFRDRTAKSDLGEFSRICLLHAVYQEYSAVNTYFKRPLSSWMPQNNPERQSEDTNLLNSDSNWRNAALDCVDTLHWAANATIASLLGAEHPTVLHLHFSRVVLLVPRTMLMTLANYLKAPESERKVASNQQKAIQAEREISEWAQQDVSKARLAALHCGCFLWHIRRYSKMAFYEPPCVFWAILTLWAYSVYSSKSRRSSGEERSGSVTRHASPDHNKAYSDDDSPTFIRLDRPNDDEMVQLFVRAGVLKAYISGVGDIYGSGAPARILKEGRKILESVSLAWGRSREYLDLLNALG
ncbi:transcription factor [Fusarium flagelliforme]|uniref:Transcription factor n=1 Tax=Fusarium flagelliforme TaxID=2675880 RepID=A0A395N1Q9_9HYPO|nr:transcription factor [Fusarium flagelliforme]